MSQPVRMLVLEDDFLISSDLAEMIENSRCAVIGPACTLQQALELDAVSPADAGIFDISINGQITFELPQLFRQSGRPFVFLTGYDRTAIPEEFRDVPVVEKPYGGEEINAACLWLSYTVMGDPHGQAQATHSE